LNYFLTLTFSSMLLKPSYRFNLISGETYWEPGIAITQVLIQRINSRFWYEAVRLVGCQVRYERKADIASKALLTLSGHAFIFKSLKAWAPHSRLLPYSFRSGLTRSRRESHQIGLTVF
jgi:hypothetical protein